MIEISRFRLPAGVLPGSLGQLSLSSLRGRLIEYQLTGWVRAGPIYLYRVAGPGLVEFRSVAISVV